MTVRWWCRCLCNLLPTHPFTHPIQRSAPQWHRSAVAGSLVEVVDQAAARLKKKRKASEMPTSPVASPTAAHRASADGQLPPNKSLAATRAAWGSPAAQGKEQQAGDHHTDRQTLATVPSKTPCCNGGVSVMTASVLTVCVFGVKT